MAKLPDNFVKAPPDTSHVTTTKTSGKLADKPADKRTDKPVGKEVRRKARRDAPPPAETTEQGAHSAHSAHSVLVRLSPEEHQALPWIMAARFAQVRIRGMRKVPPEDRLVFLHRGDLMESLVKLTAFRLPD